MSGIKATETWWRVRKFGVDAEPIDVVKSTDKTLTTIERGQFSRSAIQSEYSRHYRTATEAADAALLWTQAAFNRAERDLRDAKAFAAKAARLDAEHPHKKGSA